MWQAITSILASDNAPKVLLSILLIIVIVAVLIKSGLLKITTKHVTISKVDNERATIREQCDWAHVYLMSLESKIKPLLSNERSATYYTKYILECIYDEVVKWITFNHIQNTESYIHAKQVKIASLVYSFGIGEQFKNKEFITRIHAWTKEVIEELVRIRALYER